MVYCYYSPAFIQRRIDDISISNGPQEFASTTDILTPISTDQSPVLFSPSKEKDNVSSKGFYNSTAS